MATDLARRFMSNKTRKRDRVNALLVFGDFLLEQRLALMPGKQIRHHTIPPNATPKSLPEWSPEARAAWLYKKLRDIENPEVPALFKRLDLGIPGPESRESIWVNDPCKMTMRVLKSISGSWSSLGIPGCRSALRDDGRPFGEDHGMRTSILNLRRSPYRGVTGEPDALMAFDDIGAFMVYVVTRAYVERHWDWERLPVWLPSTHYRRYGAGDKRTFMPILLPTTAVELLIRRLFAEPSLLHEVVS